MQDRQSNFDQSLETLVRADLDRRADLVDSRALFERIRQTVASRESPPIRLPVGRRVVRWISGISAAAAAVLIVMLLATQSATPAQASAEMLLQAARKQLQVPRDRCYLVEMRKESDLLDQEDPRIARSNPSTQPTRNSLLQQSRMTLLWTRGDRFWMTPINAPQPFAWGRGQAGDYWIAMGPRRGVQFAPYEVPLPLLPHCRHSQHAGRSAAGRCAEELRSHAAPADGPAVADDGDHSHNAEAGLPASGPRRGAN